MLFLTYLCVYVDVFLNDICRIVDNLPVAESNGEGGTDYSKGYLVGSYYDPNANTEDFGNQLANENQNHNTCYYNSN